MTDEAKADAAQQTNAVAKTQTAMKLTDRDRDILGLLVLARYLTAAQVHRLAFDGKNLSLAYRRLLKLSRENGQPAFVAQRFFRTYDGNRVAVWTPTQHAMPAAVARAGQLPELPKHDVGAQFLEHLIQLNELFVALWWSGGRCPRASHPAFRWTPSDRIRLPWQGYEMGRGRLQRVIQPDAVLELPGQRRRYFLECEMGTQVICSGTNAEGATTAKVERYHQFCAGLEGVGTRQTHYDAQYPDRFVPELLFLVLTPRRAASVNAAVAKWRETPQGPRQISMRALTFDAAIAELRQLAGVPPLPARTPGARPAAPAPKPAPAGVTKAEAILLWNTFNESISSLKGARQAFRAMKRADLPQYPKTYDEALAVLGRMLSAA